MKGLLKKKYFWAIVYSVLLVSFTVYTALDTFVIKRVYMTVPPAQDKAEERPQITHDSDNNAGQENENQPLTHETDPPVIITQNSYKDADISVVLTEYREYGTDIYVADVRLSSPEYLKTAFAQDAFGRNVTEKTSKTAERNNAILAINGDCYGVREKGYVIRGGVLYRETASEGQEDLVVYKNGSLGIIKEGSVSARQLLDEGAVQVLSFGPALVTDGIITVSQNDEVGIAMASNPRTAVGIIDDLHYVFVVSDGRTGESSGLKLYQLAEFMKGLGAVTAYNLDGGGSSLMYFNGKIINNPTTNGRDIRERSVSDIVYIGY